MGDGFTGQKTQPTV